MTQQSPHLHDIAAEAAALGSILMDRTMLPVVSRHIPDAQAFSKPEHQTLYRALQTIDAQHPAAEPWDLVLIRHGLKQHKSLRAVGGVEALLEIAQSVPTAANAPFYARIVRERYLLRQMHAFGQNLAQTAALGSLPNVLTEMESQFRTLAGQYRNTDDRSERLAMRPVSDYESKAINWLWPGRFPLGMLSLVAGIQGHGKSFLMCYMAAVASRGGGWADGDNPNEPVEVAILSDEESVSYALRPRLEACGAELSRIFVFDNVVQAGRSAGAFDIESRLPLLDDFFDKHPQCRLVFFDSLAGFLGDTDPNDNAAVRATLAPLTELAERRGVAMVGILHLNKKPDLSSVHRISGATAFTAVARAVWLVVRDEESFASGARLLLPIKCNYADVAGLRYWIKDGAVVFDTDAIDTNADTALSGRKAGQEKESAVDIAADWLKGQLENQPPKPAKDLFKDAYEEGISRKSLLKAKEQLGVQSKKIGFHGGNVWSMDNSLSMEVVV